MNRNRRRLPEGLLACAWVLAFAILAPRSALAETDVVDDAVDVAGDRAAAASESAGVGPSKRYEAGNASVAVHLDRGQMGVADLLRYTLTVETKGAANVVFEAVGDTFGSFRVVEYHPLGPVHVADEVFRWQREYLLAADAAGSQSVPALKIEFYPPLQDCLTADACEMSAHGRRDTRRNPTGPDYTVTTAAMSVVVDTVLTAEDDVTKPRGAMPPIAIAAVGAQGGATAWGPWLGTAIMLAAIGFWYHQRKKPDAVADLDPFDAATTAQAAALDAAEALRREQLLDEGHAREFYTRLSDILRNYLAGRFNNSAIERTSREILEDVDHRPDLVDHKPIIAGLLNRSDLAKFAYVFPSRESSFNDLDALEAFVRRTPNAEKSEIN